MNDTRKNYIKYVPHARKMHHASCLPSLGCILWAILGIAAVVLFVVVWL